MRSLQTSGSDSRQCLRFARYVAANNCQGVEKNYVNTSAEIAPRPEDQAAFWNSINRRGGNGGNGSGVAVVCSEFKFGM